MALINRDGTVSAFPRELPRPEGTDFRANAANLQTTFSTLVALYGLPDTPQDCAPAWTIRVMKPGGWTFESGHIFLYCGREARAWADTVHTWRMGAQRWDYWALDVVRETITAFCTLEG